MIRIVYIAGPYRAQNAWLVHRNICEAETWAFQVAEAGAMPLCPHTNTSHFDGTMSDRFWLDGTMELLRRSDAIFLTPRWLESSGARSELIEAVRMRMPAFDMISDVRAWLSGQPYDDSRTAFANQAAVANLSRVGT